MLALMLTSLQCPREFFSRRKRNVKRSLLRSRAASFCRWQCDHQLVHDRLTSRRRILARHARILRRPTMASCEEENQNKNDERMCLWKRVTHELHATSSMALLCCSIRRQPSNEADSTTSSIPLIRLCSSPRIEFCTIFLWLRRREALMLEVPALES